MHPWRRSSRRPVGGASSVAAVTAAVLLSVLFLAGPASAVVGPLRLTLDPPSAAPGDSVTATAAELDRCLAPRAVPGAVAGPGPGTVTFTWDTDDVLGAAAKVSNGRASVTFVVPEGASIAEHSVSVVCDGDPAMSVSAPFKVVPPTTPPVPVPDLVGISLAAAEARIARADLETGEVTGSGDLVETQSPVAGSSVETGTAVDLDLGTAVVVTVVVPGIVGLEVPQATRRLEEAGLVLGSASASGEVVTRQSPTAFTRAQRGSAVDVTLGPVVQPLVTVPDLIGTDLADAPAVLDARGLTLGTVSGQGDVVRGQRPPPGELVPRRTAVALSVEAGVKPPALVRVPDLVGGTADQARRALAALGLRLGSPAPVADRRVLEQEPEAGVLVPAGTAVSVSLETALTPVVPTSGSGWPLVATLSVGALVLLGGAAATSQVVRNRRSRSWVDEHVRVRTGGSSRRGPRATRRDDQQQERDVVVRIEPHPDSGTHTFEEVPR